MEEAANDTVSRLVAAADAAIDDLAALTPGSVPGEDVVRLAVELQRLRARVDAATCRSAVQVGATGIPALERRRSVATVLAARTGLDPRMLADDVRLGSWLTDFAVFRRAAEEGALSRRHLVLLRRLDNARTRHRLINAQSDLVEAATTCTWAEFIQVIRYWLLAADPDGASPEHQVASRYCRLTKDADGGVVGAFRLDPIAGEAVRTALEAEEQHLFRSDAANGDGGRSPTQRRADALVAIAARGSGRAERTMPAPLVHLVLGEQVAEQLLADRPVELSAASVDGRCELIDGTPVHPRAAAEVLARASFRRLVLSADGAPLDLGRRVRAFPPHLKQVLLVAARGRCAIRGCDAPVGWLQADHVQPFSRGGPTALWNGQILCDTHNKLKRDREP